MKRFSLNNRYILISSGYINIYYDEKIKCFTDLGEYYFNKKIKKPYLSYIDETVAVSDICSKYDNTEKENFIRKLICML